jgi:hypothetical protein
VWRAVWGGTGTSRDGYIVFMPTAGPITSANLNLTAFLAYMEGKTGPTATPGVTGPWLGANPTLSSVTYGVEVCQTGGATKAFDVTDFSVSPLPHLVY